MRLAASIATVLFLLAAAANAGSLDPTGYFFPESIAPSLKEVSVISVHPPESNVGWEVFLETSTNQRYIDPKATLKGRALTFATAPVNGVRYTFAGTFTKDGNYGATQPTGVVLKGRLTRWKSGKSAASQDVKLSYSVGD